MRAPGCASPRRHGRLDPKPQARNRTPAFAAMRQGPNRHPAFEQYAKPRWNARPRSNAPSPNRTRGLAGIQPQSPQPSSSELARVEPSSLAASSSRGMRAPQHELSSLARVEPSSRPCACRAAGDRSVEPPALRASSHRVSNSIGRLAWPFEPQRSPWAASRRKAGGSPTATAVTGLARRGVGTSSLAPRARPLGSKRN
jgi:hypothetical protein